MVSSRFRVLVAAVLLAVVAGCGGGAAPAQQGASDTLTVSIGGDEGTLTPYTYETGFPGWNLMNLVYDSLLVLDAENTPTPLLASGYEVSDDGLTYTVTVRDGVTWHDGTPFTARDVAFTFDYYAANQVSRFTPQVANVADVQADGSVVTITLTAPNPDFVLRPLADMPIIPEHVWSAVTDPDGAGVEQAVGTGPYRLVEHTPDQSYRLEANPAWGLGTPRIDTLNLAVIPEDQTAISALRSGEIQAVGTGAGPNLADSVAGQAGISVAEGPEFGSTMLVMNNGVAPFDRVEVRRAIASALDPADIVATVRLGRATEGSSGWVHPSAPLSAGLPAYPTDVAAAASALDALGAAPGPDGIRVLDGAPMRFELLVYSDSPDRVRTAELISASLAGIGVAVTVVAQDADSVDARVWPDFDVANGRDYQLALWGWSAPNTLDATRVAALVNSDLVTGSLNVQGTRDAELDALSNAVLAATTPDTRLAAAQDLQRGIADRAPFVTLYYDDGLYPYRNDAFDGWVFQEGQGILQKLSLADLTG